MPAHFILRQNGYCAAGEWQSSDNVSGSQTLHRSAIWHPRFQGLYMSSATLKRGLGYRDLGS